MKTEKDENTYSQKVLNTPKYYKNYRTFTASKAMDITPWQIKLGDIVQVSPIHDKHADKKGVVKAGFSKKDPYALMVKFDDGKEALINKDYLIKITKDL